MTKNIKKTKTFNNLFDLQKAFPNEQSCRDFLEQERWNGHITCPHCESDRISKYTNGKTYFCGKCRKQFTVKVGTIFEDSALPLRKWFMAIYIVTAHKKGISSLQLSRDIGVTQKTAWHLIHRIREMIRPKSSKKLSGTIEADETYIGGKDKNKHANKRLSNNQGRSLKSKTPVLGMFERNGMITSMPIKNTTREIIQPIVKSVVEKGSKLITDELSAYTELNGHYEHSIIRHAQKEYVRGDIHTNTIEGFWSLLKRGIVGIYHNVSVKHLHRYCNEFGFRYNTRGIKDSERFTLSLGLCEGNLQYKKLIN